MRKNMNQKKRRNAHQSDGISQEPAYSGRLNLAHGDASIRNKTGDANERRDRRSGRTYQYIPDHIAAPTKAQIDLQGAAEYVCRRAITSRNPGGIDCIAEGPGRPGVHDHAGKGVRSTNEKRIPGTHS